MTETYFVAFGYNIPGSGGVSKNDAPGFGPSESLQGLFPLDSPLSRFFHLVVTPIFKIRKRRTHTFLGGLPLYYGDPGELSSLYLAVMESDRGSRKAGKALSDAMAAMPTDGLFAAIGTLAASANPELALVKQAFGLLVKVIEAALLNNKDDIRYTNVMTFKSGNDWLVGDHSGVGNHRLRMDISVQRE